MSSRARWKRQERETAKLTGGKRQPCIGKPAADVIGDTFTVEQKTRKSLPGWLTHAIDQAASAATDGKTPLVVLTEVSQGHKAKRYVLLRLEDWIDWHGTRC
jgi:hypothetical protein